MYCAVIQMTFPNCPEITTRVHHFDTYEQAKHQVNHYKQWYIRFFEFTSPNGELYTIEEFDNALDNGIIRTIMYANNFSMNNEPFEWRIVDVNSNLNKQHEHFYDW